MAGDLRSAPMPPLAPPVSARSRRQATLWVPTRRPQLPISGKRIPAVITRRLTGHTPGQQQFDYPVHTLRVLSGGRNMTLAPGGQTGLFAGVGRLDAHSYRPNEFFANNWVYEGLVEYGPGGAILPSLAVSWIVEDLSSGGQQYTFMLRQNVTFHDGTPWDCAAAKLNFDHVLAAPLTTGDYHGWYGLPGAIDGWIPRASTTPPAGAVLHSPAPHAHRPCSWRGRQRPHRTEFVSDGVGDRGRRRREYHLRRCANRMRKPRLPHRAPASRHSCVTPPRLSNIQGPCVQCYG